MHRTTKKTREQLEVQDFLNFQELSVYITGIGSTKLEQLKKSGFLPAQRVPGLWSRWDIDRWTGKVTENYPAALPEESGLDVELKKVLDFRSPALSASM